ncbi:hypothetical protein [Piscinibacter koreensis]|nr:hypothetical protein [Schlegelella koreensis]
MSREDAMKVDPTATPVEGTREVILLPEHSGEHVLNSRPERTEPYLQP